MKPEFILLTIVGGFFCALIIFLIVLYKPALPTNLNQTSTKKTSEAVSSDKDSINDLKSKIKWLEGQVKTFQEFKLMVSTQSAKTESLPNNKSILATVSTQGSVFTTNSALYTPMGMYVNISCPKNCLLWINFYSSSKNLGPIASEQGNLNTYGLFLDGADKSTYSQGSLTVANSSIPVSLNSLITVAVGTHTIEIKAKTTGGSLQSDSSSLQVMVIEK